MSICLLALHIMGVYLATWVGAADAGSMLDGDHGEGEPIRGLV